MSQLCISDLGSPALTRSREEAYAIARERTRDPHAPNTRRSYRQAYARWCAYCDALGMPWGPIEPDELVAYLELASRTLAPGTVLRHLTALSSLDQATRLAPGASVPSIRTHPVVRRWLTSWRREHSLRPRRQAQSLGASDLERMLVAAQERARGVGAAQHVATYARDRLLVLLGVLAALRASELVALDIGDVVASDRGLAVTVRRSKTDQGGEGESIAVLPQGRVSLCAVAAYRAWIGVRGSGDGRLLASVSRSGVVDTTEGLTERQVSRIVQRMVSRAGIDVDVSSHSLRATFATLASRRGVPLERIMRHGRWISAQTATRYVRQGQLFESSASSGLLDSD